MAYLDTASSAPLHPAARAVLDDALRSGWADPRRLHGAGRSARLLLDNARAVVADALDVRPDEVTFTSSGTDATHRGLLGLLVGRRRPGHGAPGPLVLTAVEHSAVPHAAAWAERWLGTPSTELGVDRLGRVRPEDLATLLPGASVLAVQSANHEVGTRQPVAACAAAAREHGVPLFVDACASAGREPLPTGWDAAAASAHKWGGPAGVGVLLVRHGARWRAPFPVDDRSDERASGFENVPAALAAAAALRAVVDDAAVVGARQSALVDRLRAGVAALGDVEVVGDPVDRMPHLVTFSFLYVDGEALVTELDRRGLAVASGSACTASTLTPSRVLEAMGVLTHGNVRVSLAEDTTEADVDALLAALAEVVPRLRAEVGL
ncbi:aminotransferase class V-fold PLP-dependent enzyme [Nocardioides sp. CFH 31398]|uniref:cysteine desulfurase family protein n=1 Tax=Nocardioides sp. CFH 31398 TaxID=2919579 RepID=UPI001F063BB1|nr:aminotransferase class V-fold PLP-dependent enzyme [Nocardioides sp. CFH 31398]MCH1868197.1 aminotransferase class V-fold PLP-dependent enzyme [Nocardioides sp. CFH 31398]